MFNDGYSPHKDMEKNPLDTADDTSCFVVYPGVIFWGCGQVVVLLLSLGLPHLHIAIHQYKVFQPQTEA